MAAKTKTTYKVYNSISQYEAVRNVLVQAEQTHYLLSLQNEELDGSLPDRLEAASVEVKRLQAIFADAEKSLPKGPDPATEE